MSDLTSLAPYRAPFDTEFELILNLAVGGQLPGRRVDDSIFPATMLVDYVRWAGREYGGIGCSGKCGGGGRAAVLHHGTHMRVGCRPSAGAARGSTAVPDCSLRPTRPSFPHSCAVVFSVLSFAPKELLRFATACC